MAKRTIADLREILFDQLTSLSDTTKDIDLDRARVINETSKQIIETAKVEVEAARVIQGAMTMPFIEDQEGAAERPFQHKSIPAPQSPPAASAPAITQSAEERILNSGPAADHPWQPRPPVGSPWAGLEKRTKVNGTH